jgi:predicted regulator of Ras-like GTPase activity (Roadblock/LC7/MglB family)
MEQTRTEILNEILKSLSISNPDIEAAAIFSTEGLPVASSLPAAVEEDRMAANSSAVLAASEKAVGELNVGDFEQVFIRGTDGYAIISRAGAEAILVIIARKDAKLGMVFFDIKRILSQINPILS